MKDSLRRFVAALFEFQARRLLRKKSFTVVAVAGSVGKTTTKLAIATVLKQKYRTLVQHGSFNDEIGLPLACFDLDVPGNIFNPVSWVVILVKMELALHRPYPYEVLVIEVGTDAPGEIARTLKYLKPDLGVVTGIAPEHMEYFKTIEAVAEEEFTLARGAVQAVLNNSFNKLHPLAKALKTPAVWYDVEAVAPFMAKLIADGRWRDHQWPSHIQQALGAAVVVATQLKLNQTQIIEGLADFSPAPGRMQQLAGVNGSLIIDDTYNSSPEAITAAMTYLTKLPVTGRRIAIMGRMNELGDNSPKYHTEVGPACAGVDYLVTVGDMATQFLGPAAVLAGLDPTRFQPADSPVAAGEHVKLILRPGDVVLVKGSQNGVFTEEAVKVLLANPADAAKLVRQSPSWMAKKRAQFTDIPA